MNDASKPDGTDANAGFDARLVGQVPDVAAFEAEFPGADLASTLLARSLVRLGRDVEAAIAIVWRRHGLSHAGGNALAVIEGARTPMTAGEISASMHITSGSITSLLDTLEGRSLVRRMAHQNDRRKVLVAITDEGQRLLDAALPAIQLMVLELMRAMTEAERLQLLGLLRRAHDAVSSADLTNVPTGRRHHPGADHTV